MLKCRVVMKRCRTETSFNCSVRFTVGYGSWSSCFFPNVGAVQSAGMMTGVLCTEERKTQLVAVTRKEMNEFSIMSKL